MMPNSLKNIEPCSNMPNIGTTFYIYNKISKFKIVTDCTLSNKDKASNKIYAYLFVYCIVKDTVQAGLTLR